MKPNLINLFLLLIIISITNEKANAQAYGENINIIHFGVGFISKIENSEQTPSYSSTYVDSENYSPQVLPLTIVYEKGITNHFSIGGYLGYESYYVSQNINTFLPFPNGNVYYKWSWNEFLIILAARGSFHFWTSNHFDTYIGLMFGYQFHSIKNYTSDNSNYPPPNNTSNGNSAFGGYLGINYYFSDTFGVYLESGYGNVAAALNIGVSLRF